MIMMLFMIYIISSSQLDGSQQIVKIYDLDFWPTMKEKYVHLTKGEAALIKAEAVRNGKASMSN